MKTIIQSFPTIYGEAINGSVLGQPNGSIARPPQNVPVTLELSGDSVEVVLSFSGSGTTHYTVDMLNTLISGFTYSYLQYVVKASDDSTIATSPKYFGALPYTIEVAGATSAEPSDGDTVTVYATIYDEDDAQIASDSISATAVMSI